MGPRQRCVFRRGTDVVVSTRLLEADPWPHGATHQPLASVVLVDGARPWEPVGVRPVRAKKHVEQDDKRHAYFLHGVKEPSPKKPRRGGVSHMEEKGPQVDDAVCPAPDLERAVSDCPTATAGDCSESGDEIYKVEVGDEESDGASSEWSVGSAVLEASAVLPPRAHGSDLDLPGCGAGYSGSGVVPGPALPGSIRELVPPPVPLPEPEEIQQRARGVPKGDWCRISVHDHGGDLLGYLVYNEQERKINAHCEKHESAKAHCHMDRAIIGRRRGQGRPIGTLVAWLRSSSDYDDKAAHQAAKRDILALDGLPLRVESRGWVTAQPAFAALFALERELDADEASEPEVAV